MKLSKIFVILVVFLFLLNLLKEKICLYIFNVSGEINITTRTEIKPNAMLYIAVYNDKGLIFAFKEIINPQFPLKFKLNYKNVLYPKLITSRCKIRAVLNYHGNLNELRQGDIYSENKNIYIIQPFLNINLDRVKG